MTRVEQITGPCAYHGEGPVWHPNWPGLRWVDMLAGDVLTLENGTVHRQHVGSVAAALRPCRGGGAVLALERGFAIADDDLTGIRPLGELWTDPSVRMNEGSCDPDGRFYCGSMAYDQRPEAGTLYRLDGAGTVEEVLRGITISNGLAWSPDGTNAFHVDTPTQRIDVFDYADGELRNRRPLVHIDPEAGAPDGLTVDADGGVWVALWGGGAVHHYSAGGELLDVLEVPAPRTTACTFGGPNRDELYITTSKIDTDLKRYPGAGAVFRAKPPVRGLPPLPYLSTAASG